MLRVCRAFSESLQLSRAEYPGRDLKLRIWVHVYKHGLTHIDRPRKEAHNELDIRRRGSPDKW